VIKAIDLRPGRSRMTGFAAKGRAVAAQFLHAVAELPAMRVGVTRGAGLVRKSKRQDIVAAVRKPGFVAFVARNRGVCAGQHEFSFLVLRNREERPMEVAHGVARLAAIVVRRPRKLAVVDIRVAVRAVREFHLVDRCATRWQVALGTLHASVSAFQRVLGSRVFFHAKERRLPVVDGVALGALALPRALGELALVNVEVAIHAVRKSQRLFEIASYMTGRATHRRVLAQQRVPRLGVIKSKDWEQFFPAGGPVAGLATLRRERPFMWVHVTINAGAESHIAESRWSAGFIRLMAFFTSHFDVHPRQRITRLRMVELLRGFPIVYVVTALAIVSQLVFVRVRMAGKAVLRQAEEALRQVFVLNQWPEGGRDIFRNVTLLAR